MFAQNGNLVLAMYSPIFYNDHFSSRLTVRPCVRESRLIIKPNMTPTDLDVMRS